MTKREQEMQAELERLTADVRKDEAELEEVKKLGADSRIRAESLRAEANALMSTYSACYDRREALERTLARQQRELIACHERIRDEPAAPRHEPTGLCTYEKLCSLCEPKEVRVNENPYTECCSPMMADEMREFTLNASDLAGLPDRMRESAPSKFVEGIEASISRVREDAAKIGKTSWGDPRQEPTVGWAPFPAEAVTFEEDAECFALVAHFLVASEDREREQVLMRMTPEQAAELVATIARKLA
jgi:hypothetical protein